MSVKVTIPTEALSNPRVSTALAELILALGNLPNQQKIKPRVDEEVFEGPRRRRRRSNRGGVHPQVGRNHHDPHDPHDPHDHHDHHDHHAPPAPITPVEPLEKRDSKNEDEKKYREFVDGLPERSRDFLALLKSRGELSISEAMQELGIDVSKAMGGITGSISRWAPVRGVPVPFEAGSTESGERMWRWTRVEPEHHHQHRNNKERGKKDGPHRHHQPKQGHDSPTGTAEVTIRRRGKGVHRRRGKEVTPL